MNSIPLPQGLAPHRGGLMPDCVIRHADCAVDPGKVVVRSPVMPDAPLVLPFHERNDWAFIENFNLEHFHTAPLTLGHAWVSRMLLLAVRDQCITSRVFIIGALLC